MILVFTMQNYDWEFNFNPAVSSSSLNYNALTQATVNSTVCNVGR